MASSGIAKYQRYKIEFLVKEFYVAFEHQVHVVTFEDYRKV
jgi:hypothetical protein